MAMNNWWTDNTGMGSAVGYSRVMEEQMEELRRDMYRQMEAAMMPATLIFDAEKFAYVKETKQNQNKKLLLCPL